MVEEDVKKASSKAKDDGRLMWRKPALKITSSMSDWKAPLQRSIIYFIYFWYWDTKIKNMHWWNLWYLYAAKTIFEILKPQL